MTLPQPIRATILFVLVLLTFGVHLACQARTRQPRLGANDSKALAVAGERAEEPPASVAGLQIQQPARQATDHLVTLMVQTDRTAVLRGRDGVVHIEVNLRTSGPANSAARNPVDMAVILDRSGSMSGSKVEYAKTALRQLIMRLDEGDRLGIVVYDTTGQVLVPMQVATGRAKRAWLAMVDAIDVRGNTNMSQGLDLAQDMLEAARLPNRNARVLLLSDGLANTGDSSLTGLTRRARRAISGEYALSTIGIGSDFDERLMTQLATAGDGAFYYLAKLDALARFFEAEFATAATTVATRGRLQLRLPPGARLLDAMGLPFESRGNQAEIALGSLYVNHERSVWLTLQLPTSQVATTPLGHVILDYRRSDGTSEATAVELPKVACVDDWAVYRNGVNKAIWERAVVEEELARSEERLGDAIASGSAADVDVEVARAKEHQRLAESLGSQKVVSAIQRFDSSAATARVSQRAEPSARNLAAKRQKADGYIKRNSAKYMLSDPTAGY
jgi:Ca-activated chloride channel homolog